MEVEDIHLLQLQRCERGVAIALDLVGSQAPRRKSGGLCGDGEAVGQRGAFTEESLGSPRSIDAGGVQFVDFVGLEEVEDGD